MTTLFKDGKPSTPSGLRVAPQSYASLEKVAMELQNLLPKAAAAPFKLDCARVLEKTLPQAGYQLKIEEIDQLNDCAAFTIPEQGIVVFREDIYDLLLDDNVFGRSTVIHELSHLVLRHAVTLHRGAKLGEHDFCRDSEWQAKSLTAAVMMPIEACRAAKSAHSLAEMCGTSVQAAGYRLQRLIKEGIVQPQRGLWED